MSHQTQSPSLQYMTDVGVPVEDVAWLERTSRHPLGTPAEKNRVDSILDMAFKGLCATIKTPGFQLNAR